MTGVTLILLLTGLSALVNGASLPEGRIVGGGSAVVNEFPWQVSLRRNVGQHFCGGTLIADRKVLTAAYCVEPYRDTPSSVHVVTGSISLAQGGEYHAVSDVRIHDNYTAGERNSWRNDIAIITLAIPASRSPAQSPIAYSDVHVPAGSSAITSGWGVTVYPGSTFPTVLQKYELTVLSNIECQNRHSLNTIYEDQICALSSPGQGACTGDSGSPLVVDNEVVGITSWVRPCGLGYPDVYTRVSSFARWINEHLNDGDSA